MKIIHAFFVCVLVFGLSGCDTFKKNEAQGAVKDKLLDGDSAKFKDVIVYDKLGTISVCGSVNAKNSYGAYTGYRRFYWLSIKNHASIEKENNIAELQEIFNVMWEQYCK